MKSVYPTKIPLFSTIPSDLQHGVSFNLKASLGAYYHRPICKSSVLALDLLETSRLAYWIFITSVNLIRPLGRCSPFNNYGTDWARNT